MLNSLKPTTKHRRTWRTILAISLALGGQAAWLDVNSSAAASVICPAASELEARTIAAAPKCVATTVGLVVRTGDQNNMKMGSGSGVLVSADGLILTAGHVVDKPGTPLTIRLTDGRVVQGIALGVDRQADTGLARINDAAPDGGWPFSPMAPADSARQGDWVLTTGNPGSIIIGRNPPLRLGRVTSHNQRQIMTNITMEPGDSGGPVFDLSGRVVGINSQIMVSRGKNDRLSKDQSMHVPISLFTTQWDDLITSKNMHPEAAAGMGGTAPQDMGDMSRIGEALHKLANEKDAEAQQLLDDARKNGGRMNLTPDRAKELVAKAHLDSSPATQPSPLWHKHPGISGQLRPMIGPQIKRSLLQQFPGAKISDQLLQRIMDKSTFDPTNGHMEVHPDLEDLLAMGLSPESLGVHADGGTSLNNRVSRELTKSSLQTLSLLAPALDAAGDCVVEILADNKPILLGTIVDADGLVITKASELPDHPIVILADGQKLAAKILGKEDATDLALLKIDAKGLTAAKFSDDAPLGAWLGSPVFDPNQPVLGVVSIAARPIPGKFAHFAGEQRVILGLGFLGNDSIVSEVTPGMPADTVGIKTGDLVLELDGKTFSHAGDFVAEIRKAKSGDILTIKIRRDGKEMEFKPVLGQRKNTTETMDGIGEVDQLAGGKISKRRTNFPMAIQHDGTVWADQCGGPLINLQGQTVGINIARYDRVCTFAIPAELVQKTIVELQEGKRAN